MPSINCYRKVILVSVGVLLNTRGEVLLGQRIKLPKKYKWWEFPGGKVEESESPQDALSRELYEELGISVVADSCCPITFHVKMCKERPILVLFYYCRTWSSAPYSKEHQPLAWVHPEQLSQMDILPSNVEALPRIISYINQLNTC